MMRALVLSAIHVCALATKIADLGQGSLFTKCMTVSDFETKTADDDITLQDRDANGCCPEATVPGVKLYTKYWGAQVVCGVEADGDIGTISGSGTPRTCNYQSCYVTKIADKIKCVDDATPLLNGCCGATKGSRTFVAACKDYEYTASIPTATSTNAKPDYCLSYHTSYSTLGYDGTAADADDVADSTFQVDKFYAYANCARGSGSTGSGSGTSGSSGTSGVATASSSISSAALGAATLVSVAFVFTFVM